MSPTTAPSDLSQAADGDRYGVHRREASRRAPMDIPDRPCGVTRLDGETPIVVGSTPRFPLADLSLGNLGQTLECLEARQALWTAADESPPDAANAYG